jgi:microsomal dipeptidase-like Zn-dependent dipeptidase
VPPPFVRPDLPPLDIDNWGFEHGLLGWERTGEAFEAQPTFGDNVLAHRVVNPSTGFTMPLGGDYWREVSFPVGHKGQRWVGTYERRPNALLAPGSIQGDAPRGTLTSKPFVVRSGYISFLIGGGHDPDRLTVELLEERGGQWRPVAGTARTGFDTELMRREWWDLRALHGRTLRIRITDDSSAPWGHINVDDFVFQDRAPNRTRVPLGGGTVAQVVAHAFRPFRAGSPIAIGHVDWDAPVWGVTDMHTHPMTHLGFGRRILCGAPDGDPADALGDCRRVHGGNMIRSDVVIKQLDELHTFADPDIGYPAFVNWPVFDSITHQQMWHEWIERAFRGGLRVMVALATHNQLLAEAADGDEPKRDKASGDLQLRALHDFVGRHPFMRIARDPAELRSIVRNQQLAVVVGVELDNLGDFNFADVRSDAASVRAEIQRLHRDLSVRYIFPVHVTDNKFGGAAVYKDLFNLANRFNRVQPAPPAVGALIPFTSFAVEHAPDPLVRFQLKPHLVSPLVLGARALLEGVEHLPLPGPNPCFPCGDPFAAIACAIAGLDYGTCHRPHLQAGDLLNREPEYQVVKHYYLTPDPLTDSYAFIPPGHRNVRGIEALGRVAMDEMMRLGMMIDIDHMSERMVDDVIDLASKIPGGGYPLQSGHNSFRTLGQDNENGRSDHQIARLAELGGMMGIGWGYEPDKSQTPVAFADVIANRPRFSVSDVPYTAKSRCGGTASRFAQAYLYAIESGIPLALGTDINGLVPTPGPRFGKRSTAHGNVCVDQQRPVSYLGGPGGGANVPLAPARMGARTWDVNTEGVAHYGLLPDFLQDLRNVGVQPSDLTPLFQGAEQFARAWQRSLQASTQVR